MIKIVPESVPIDYTIPYPQDFTFIIGHKELEFDGFQDISLRQYITDQNVPGFIQIKSEYDSRVLGELPFWKWAATQIRDEDTATINHYRRKTNPTMAKVMVPEPMPLKVSILEQTAYYHSPKVADALLKALPPDESNILRGNMFFPYNIAKMPRKLIWEYVNFIEPRLLRTMEILGCPLDYCGALEFMKNDPSFTTPIEGKNTDPKYQCRIGGCIMERLSTIFFNKLTQVPKEFKKVSLLEKGQKI